jgi:hypothetical protein
MKKLDESGAYRLTDLGLEHAKGFRRPGRRRAA